MPVDNSAIFGFAAIVITGMLVAIGVQVFLILRELQRTIQKTNKVLDDTGTVSESISRPISMLSNTLTGIREGAGLVRMIREVRGHQGEKGNRGKKGR